MVATVIQMAGGTGVWVVIPGVTGRSAD